LDLLENNRIIFTFWEPSSKLPAYLQLCKKTWEKNLIGYEIRVLDYSNVDAYIGSDVYDMAILRQLPLPMQKDAIMFAILQGGGGTFMDLDTLVRGDIAPIVDQLQTSEVVMFNSHLAFVSARANSHLHNLCVGKVQKKLAWLKEVGVEDSPGWDFLGNSVLASAKEELIASFFRGHVLARGFYACTRFLAMSDAQGFRGRLARKWMGYYFRRFLKQYLAILDGFKMRFIPEGVYFNETGIKPEEKYRRFWFESALSVGTAFSKDQRLIALHNSWTPEWYKALPEKDVLMHPCLLSRTIKHILEV